MRHKKKTAGTSTPKNILFTSTWIINNEQKNGKFLKISPLNIFVILLARNQFNIGVKKNLNKEINIICSYCWVEWFGRMGWCACVYVHYVFIFFFVVLQLEGESESEYVRPMWLLSFITYFNIWSDVVISASISVARWICSSFFLKKCRIIFDTFRTKFNQWLNTHRNVCVCVHVFFSITHKMRWYHPKLCR